MFGKWNSKLGSKWQIVFVLKEDSESDDIQWEIQLTQV